VRSAVVVIVVRDASTDQRFVECVCGRCGTFVSFRTPVHHVRCYMPPSPSWSFGFKLSFHSLAFRPVSMCLCVRVCVRVLLQMRLWACLSHVYTCRCAVRFSFSAAAAPAHTLRAPLLPSSPLLVSRRSTYIDGRATGRLAPIHTHRHCVLGPSRFLQVTDGLVLSRGSSPAQQNGCAVLCCHPLFIPVVV
jgi:hypothetical protein